MVAFRAEADHEAPLNVDAAELEAARWFDRAEVARAAELSTTMDPDATRRIVAEHPDLRCLVPPRGVIARTLIDAWLAETDGREPPPTRSVAFDELTLPAV